MGLLTVPTTTVKTPFDVPVGLAVALPSIRLSTNASVSQLEDRQHYGGAGDKKHLGGFIEFDRNGVSPSVWKDMISYFGVKSVLDVGCGRGISTSWFLTHGVQALCVEGSHDARERTMLPDPDTQMIEHDFSRGPWWPARTVDAVWCVEFVEHVGRNYQPNYLPAFRKAALLFVTHATRGGWHHVEVHHGQWWINKWEMMGFRYSQGFTKRIRDIAENEGKRNVTAPNGEAYEAFYIQQAMHVFINPHVAALPQHAHLLAEPGCHQSGFNDMRLNLRPCQEHLGETELPASFQPLKLTPEMDQAWEELVKKHISKGVVVVGKESKMKKKERKARRGKNTNNNTVPSLSSV
jgi:hypothetical protein